MKDFVRLCKKSRKSKEEKKDKDMVELKDLMGTMNFAEDFERVETVITLQKKSENLDANMPILNKGKKVLEVKPNVIVSQKRVQNSKTIEDYVVDGTADLARSIGNLENFEKGEFVFADGNQGYKLSYNVPLPASTRAHQVHIYRLDPGLQTTFTFTVRSDMTTPKVLDGLYQSVASFTTQN